MPATLWQEALFIYLVFWVVGEGLEAWPIHRDYSSLCAKECPLVVLIFGMLDRPRIGGMQGNIVLALWKQASLLRMVHLVIQKTELSL